MTDQKTKIKAQMTELRIRKREIERELENLEDYYNQMSEEKKKEYQEKTNTLKANYASKAAQLARETEAMIKAHETLRKRFFEPTEEEKELFQEDIPNFLLAYAESGSIKDSCKSLKHLKPKDVYYLRQKEPNFKEDFEVAQEIFKDFVNDTLRERAIKGTKTPIIFRGEVVDHENIPDNRLLETLVKAELPHLYDRKSLDRIPDAERPQVNIQLVSFKGDDSQEPKINNIGEVLEVDDSGRVRRIEAKDVTNKEKKEIIKGTNEE